MLCNHGEMEEKIKEGCERQVYHRITCKEIIIGRNVSMEEKRVKEQYSPANIDVWIRDLDMK